MKRINVVQCQLVREKTITYDFKNISKPSDGAKIIKAYIGNSDRENFIIACLDARNNITAIHTVSVGSINETRAHPREVFKIAILANSASIIIAHNHPSGDPSPSEEDVNVTRRITNAGKILGIEVLDHIVIGDDEQYFSFKENGLI